MISRRAFLSLTALLMSAAATGPRADINFEQQWHDLPSCWTGCIATYSNCAFLDLECYCKAGQGTFLTDTISCVRSKCAADSDNCDSWLNTLDLFCNTSGFSDQGIPSSALSAASSLATAKTVATTQPTDSKTTKTVTPTPAAPTTAEHTTAETSSPSSTSKASSKTTIVIDQSSTLVVATSAPLDVSSAPVGGVITSFYAVTLTSTQAQPTTSINPQETNGSPFLGQPGSDGVRNVKTLGAIWTIAGVGFVLGMGMIR